MVIKQQFQFKTPNFKEITSFDLTFEQFGVAANKTKYNSARLSKKGLVITVNYLIDTNKQSAWLADLDFNSCQVHRYEFKTYLNFSLSFSER